MALRFALIVILAASSCGQESSSRYAVLCEREAAPGFHAAAAALAKHHGAPVTPWDGRASAGTLATLRKLLDRSRARK